MRERLPVWEGCTFKVGWQTKKKYSTFLCFSLLLFGMELVFAFFVSLGIWFLLFFRLFSFFVYFVKLFKLQAKHKPVYGNQQNKNKLPRKENRKCAEDAKKETWTILS